MLLLKIPIGGMLWIVWWAIHKTDEEPVARRRRGRRQQGRRARSRLHPRPPRPRPPAPRPARRRAAAGAAARRAASSRAPARSSIERSQRRAGGEPAGASSVLSDGTIRRLVADGTITIDPWDPDARPAGERRPSARQLVPRLPQPPRLGDRPARPADEPHRADHDRARRAVRDPSRRVLPRRDARVRRAPRRHRRADRGQILARTPRVDRARDRRLLRPGLAGHADARAQQPHARADQAVVGPARSPSSRS